MQIKELVLFTPNLAAQLSFYEEILGLEVVNQTGRSCSFSIGSSILKFVIREMHSPYHFAINIPHNQTKVALSWLKDRVEVLKDEDNEIQDFEFWQAEAMYFYDADNNIVEFIARRTLDNASTSSFDVNSLCCISEIGLPTSSITTVFESIDIATQIPIYSGSMDRFCAVGDASGLFIIIDKNKKKTWYPTTDEALAADFEVSIQQEKNNYQISYLNEKITINQS